MRKEDFIMKPKVDFCFKELMANAKVRTGFISALLKMKPEEIEGTMLLPTIMERESMEDKTGILDVRISLKNKTQMDMEIQVKHFEMWTERSLFYWSKMYSSQIHRGDEYDSLEKCIHVGILGFDLYPNDKEYYHSFHLWDDKHHIKYSDKAEIHVLELSKLSEYEYPEDELLRWATFLNAEKKEVFEMMAKQDPYIDEAYDQLIKLSADEKKRLAYEDREKALRDYNWQISSNRKQGIKEGVAQAKAQYKRLVQCLAKDNRMDELVAATDNEELWNELCKEYNIE